MYDGRDKFLPGANARSYSVLVGTEFSMWDHVDEEWRAIGQRRHGGIAHLHQLTCSTLVVRLQVVATYRNLLTGVGGFTV